MLDRIQNDNLDTISQGLGLEKISQIGIDNPYTKTDKTNFFVDESDISSVAVEKYQRELDVNKFSDILKNIDEKEANNLVLQGIFSGKFDFGESEISDLILNNKNFLNDVFE